MQIVMTLLLSFLLAPANTSSDWESIPVPDQAVFHRICALQDHFWAVDYGNGFVYRSADGGLNWKLAAELGSEYLEAIQFVDARNGFVCGDYGFVYKTTDAGDTWVEISPPIEGRIIERYRNDPTADQEPDGFFVAYYSMFFKDENKGFISGFKLNPARGRDSFQRLFFQTIDGGDKWSSVPGDKVEGFLERFKQGIPRKDITIHGEYFPDPRHSWKLRKNRARQNTVVHHDFSTARADTVVLPSAPFDRVMLRSIVFSSAEDGFIFGGSLDPENRKSVVYRSEDGGKSWSLMDSPWPHIHFAFKHDGFLWVSGKEGTLIRKKIRWANQTRTCP